LLHRESIILECTSGNTGIAFAMVGAARGYRVAIVMSERASGERRKIIQHFGAELILFADAGYKRGIEMTREMAQADPRYFLPRQFENPLNALDHEWETGVEMLEQSEGRVDCFVSGYGTGGTLAGCSKALKKGNAMTQIFAMEPAEAALLTGEEACCHWIEGIAGGFVPPLLQGVELSGVVKVSSQEAMEMTLRLNREFGLLVGSSSGANVAAALRVARNFPSDARVVTILCDRAESYFSTRLFGDCA
jgi:cysteine synthase A